MATVFVILGVLFYAGPCMLAYHLGKKQGYIDGYSNGEKEGIERERRRWEILTQKDFYK